MSLGLGTLKLNQSLTLKVTFHPEEASSDRARALSDDEIHALVAYMRAMAKS